VPEAVTPPNPDQSDSGRHGNPPQSIPDPTLMTIDALRREIAMLESLLNSRIGSNEQLTRERFHRVDRDLEHFESQRKEQKQDTKEAVDAALESQKEATAKMETSVSEQIASLRDNFETSLRGVHSNIADLKDRMTITESIKQGVVEQRTESRSVTTGMVAAIGLGIALIVAVITAIGFFAGSP